MKANAPEKIYLDEDESWHLTNPNGDSVEYIHTDAFIEKACGWLKESITNNPECNRIISKKGVITMGELIEEFRKYMGK